MIRLLPHHQTPLPVRKAEKETQFAGVRGVGSGEGGAKSYTVKKAVKLLVVPSRNTFLM
jgi:hypothetical protein